MVRTLIVMAALLVSTAIGVAQAPGGRRGRGDRQPDAPLPNIREYKPTSTLVVPEHLVPRAKFPVIDMHGHPPPLTSAEALDQVIAAMDPLNLRVMVAIGNPGLIPREQMRQDLQTIAASKYKDRFAVFANISLRNVGPGFGQMAAEQLEADVKAGAVGLGEIMKDFGLAARKADGTRLKLDDPELDPIWATAARLNIPVSMHVGDPAPFWNAFDYSNERYLEMALFPNRRCPADRCPSFEELMGERDRLIKKHPKTRFVLAHFGWHANDLGRLGRMFDQMPNLYVDTGAILYELGRQPRFAREFFVRYQDRVMFGKDTFAPEEYPYFWRTFETADEYFDYYRDYHAFWKLNGLDLPDVVLRKLYFENALKVVPGLPRVVLRK